MASKYSAVVLSLLLSRHDANHDNWATVEWARAMVATSRDLQVPHALTDREGRPIVDSLPPVADVVPGSIIVMRSVA